MSIWLMLLIALVVLFVGYVCFQFMCYLIFASMLNSLFGGRNKWGWW